MTLEFESDIGTLRFMILTIALKRPLVENDISKCRKCMGDKTIVVLTPAGKTIDIYHVLYPAYLCLRDYIRSTLRFKDLGVCCLTLMSGSRQIRDGIAIMSPIGSKYITLAVVSLKKVEYSIKCIFEVLADLIDGYAIGVSARPSDPPFTSLDEFWRSIIECYIAIRG